MADEEKDEDAVALLAAALKEETRRIAINTPL